MITQEEFEDLKARVSKLEGRQFELATKITTLALLLSERDKPVPVSRNTPPGGANSTERWRAMQKLAFELGAEFGATRTELKDLVKRYSK